MLHELRLNKNVSAAAAIHFRQMTCPKTQSLSLDLQLLAYLRHCRWMDAGEVRAVVWKCFHGRDELDKQTIGTIGRCDDEMEHNGAGEITSAMDVCRVSRTSWS